MFVIFIISTSYFLNSELPASTFKTKLFLKNKSETKICLMAKQMFINLLSLKSIVSKEDFSKIKMSSV